MTLHLEISYHTAVKIDTDKQHLPDKHSRWRDISNPSAYDCAPDWTVSL